MKNKILFLSVIGAALVMLAQAAPLGFANLQWDYPTNQLSTNLSFQIWGSSNIAIPLTNWLTLTNLVGTSTTARVRIPAGQSQYFLSCTASNVWGRSDFSGVLAIQPVPGSPQVFRLISLE